jgi:glycosyltransferase involved in cell wall biosynthesis
MISDFVQSLVVNSADHLICTTGWLREIAIERYKFNGDHITIIPNYVNTDVFKPLLPKKRQVVFAGRLHWSKGVDTLIIAFKGFSKKYRDYKLVIIGAGEEDKSLRAMAADNDNIVFTGSITNSRVAEYFNESEIFVLPSVNMEGHPKALVEAMAAGCKCITSDVPGNNNVLIESNSTDLLFPSQNAAVLERVLGVAAERTTNPQYDFAIRNYSSNICFEKEFKILKALK